MRSFQALLSTFKIKVGKKNPFADTQGTMPWVLLDSLKAILTKILNYAILMVCGDASGFGPKIFYPLASISLRINIWVASESVKVLIKQY